jgi:hypothetical protein
MRVGGPHRRQAHAELDSSSSDRDVSGAPAHDALVPELGREFGDRDHSTIQHGAKKIEAEVQQDADLAYKVRLIEGELRLRPNL